MKHCMQADNQRGSAMVIALMTLVLLTMVGTYFLAQTKTETQIAGHDQRSVQAMYNAEAGFGEVLARMANDADSTNYIGQKSSYTPGWGTYVVQSAGDSQDDPNYHATETDGLDNDGDGSVDESNEHYPEVATEQVNNPINYPWVNVHYKMNSTGQVILFGDHDDNLVTPPQFNLVDGFPVIVVTSRGGQGSANRTVEIEAVKVPFEILDTAVYAEKDQFKFNGTQFLVSGQDHDPLTGQVVVGSSEVSGILTNGDPANITGSLAPQQQNNVEGTGAEPSVTTAPVTLDLDAMAEAYAAYADEVIPGGTYSGTSYGSYDDYTIVHCTGDMHISGNLTGGGLLIVDGDFTCSGSFTWYGVVLILGDMTFTGGGSNIHIYGSTLVKGTTADQTVGGNADLLYSSAALSKMTALSPYQVLNWREVN
jgi:hypothetical protein